MFRCTSNLKEFRRSVYIRSNPTLARRTTGNNGKKVFRSDTYAEDKTREEVVALDAQLKELKEKQVKLRSILQEAKDRDLQAKVAQREGSKLDGQVPHDEIAQLDTQLRTVSSPKVVEQPKSIEELLPSSILELLPQKNPSQGIQLFKSRRTNWLRILEQLPVLPTTMSTNDVETLVGQIPLQERTRSLVILEEIVPMELRTQFVQDQFMASYAELRQPQKIEEILALCQSPTVFSYGHLTKALFRTKSDPETILTVLKRMTSVHGLKPSLPIFSTAIQSFIQHGRFSEAESLFDNMKYWSVSTQPDLKLYNSMILSAAKQYNVNRCMDLLNELKTRQPFPLKPNAETYNYIVYACARNPETHTLAWDMFTEAQAEGFAPDRRTFQALIYLCGHSGEVVMARALVRSLVARSVRFLDDFTLNSLMTSYRTWTPGPSQILNSPAGRNIRAKIIAMQNDGEMNITEASHGDKNSPMNGIKSEPIPFLPLAHLDRRLILLESNALMEYFAEHSPRTLTAGNVGSMASTPVINNYLSVAMNLGEDSEEFKRRFNRYTYFVNESRILEPEEEAVSGEVIESASMEGDDASRAEDKDVNRSSLVTASSRNTSFAIPRDHHLYRLALQAATKFRNLVFGKQIWTERGAWRKTSAFRNLPQSKRNRMDFQFARSLVDMLAVCGRLEEAVMVVRSAKNLKQWRRSHLNTLIAASQELEDYKTLTEIKYLLRSDHDDED